MDLAETHSNMIWSSEEHSVEVLAKDSPSCKIPDCVKYRRKAINTPRLWLILANSVMFSDLVESHLNISWGSEEHSVEV